MNTFENIAAPASAVGGAVSIIRISGPDALAIAERIWHSRQRLDGGNTRKMLLGKVGMDQCLAVYMQKPASYTGDDVVEIHCHGGAAAARNVLQQTMAAGCRMAEPGEFTFRAFVNGKLDLVQAEAVADVINASGNRALEIAENQLSGVLSVRLQNLVDRALAILAECESRLDFPEEELDWDKELDGKILAVKTELDSLLATRDIGQSLKEGVNIVIAGRPNAGKSSLFNRLLGYDRAIVTEIAGTTRDTVREPTVLRGFPVVLTDTAGLRESLDVIEKIGIARSFASIKQAEVTFWLLDASSPDRAGEVAEMTRLNPPNCIAVWNKMDAAVLPLPEVAGAVNISVKNDENIELLLDVFAEKVFSQLGVRETDVAVNLRHAGLLEQSSLALAEAVTCYNAGDFELAALNLRLVVQSINQILGKSVDPDVLDHIFSRFCIGK